MTIRAAVVMVFSLIFSASFAVAEPLGEGQQLSGEGKISITEVKRRKGIVTVKGEVSCERVCGGSTSIYQAYLLDQERGVKYHIIKTSDNNSLVSESIINFKSGRPKRFWVKFAAPPTEVTEIDFYPDDVEPIEGLPITDK